MVEKVPIRTVFDNSGNPSGLAEFQSGESVGYIHGGTGLSVLGANNQVLRTNSIGTAIEWGTINLNPYQLVANSRSELANTNARINLLNTNLLSTNNSIRSYIDSSIADIVGAAPETLDTLNELAAAINDDSSFNSTISALINSNLANTNFRIDLVNNNLTSTNTSIRTLVASNLANTNSYIANVQSDVDANEATERAALANTNAYIATKADIESPTFTGTPAAPTPNSGTNTTQIATTAFVRTEIANLIDSSPSTLDTLNELAAAINDDANFATTISNSLATKLEVANSFSHLTVRSGNTNSITTVQENVPLNAAVVANPDGHLAIVIGGVTYKIPYFL